MLNSFKATPAWMKLLFMITQPLILQGRCNREKPPCKYFHPPQHLKDQLLINGRNHLALKNALMQQMGYMSQPFLAGAGQFPSIVSNVSRRMLANVCHSAPRV